MLKKSKEVPIKNYIYLILIIVISIIFVYYLYLWFIEYQKEQNKISYVNEVMQIINYNELDTYLIENKNAIIYVTNTSNQNNKKLEKKLKRLIEDNYIVDKILFLDVSEIKNTNGKYIISSQEISIPSFLVYKDNKLLTKYEIDIDNYKIKEINNFLIEMGVINND